MIGSDFKNILFLDIETVPQYSNYESCPASLQSLWDKKAVKIRDQDTDTPDIVYQKAGIYAEFGKIICISVAFMKSEKLFVKSFASEDNEELILQQFSDMVENFFIRNKDLMLCAHNGKEFDFPYIARRMMIHRVHIPDVLNTAGKKPWEIKNIDTMELWKFGDFKNYTSLNLLAHLFNIPSPKDDIDGSMVYEVFYKEKGLKRIVQYCEKDVITVAQLMRAYNYLPLIKEEMIEIKE